MARDIRRGEIRQYRFKSSDKLRPVLIISRQEAIELLHTVMVAPITSTIHGAPSELILGIDEGLKNDSAINFDHIQTVEKSKLHTFIGALSEERLERICRPLGIAVGCI